MKIGRDVDLLSGGTQANLALLLRVYPVSIFCNYMIQISSASVP